MSVQLIRWSAVNSRRTVLPFRLLAWISRRRSAGSSMSVASEQQRGDLRSDVVVSVSGAHTHRNLSDQRLVGERVRAEQVSSQRTRADGEYDVVEFHPERVFHTFRFGKRYHCGGERAIRGQASVDGRSWRLERLRGRVVGERVSPHGDALSNQLGREASGPDRPHCSVRRGHRDPVDEWRFGFGFVRRWLRIGFGIGLHVVEECRQLRARLAIDDRVMDLGEQADLPFLETLNQPHLPERPGTVDLVADKAPYELAEGLPVTRAGNADTVDVVGDVEVGVVDPDRAFEPQSKRALQQLPAKLGGKVQSTAQLGDDLVEREPVTRRRIEKRQRRDVEVPLRALAVEKGGVGTGDLSIRHRCSSCPTGVGAATQPTKRSMASTAATERIELSVSNACWAPGTSQ